MAPLSSSRNTAGSREIRDSSSAGAMLACGRAPDSCADISACAAAAASASTWRCGGGGTQVAARPVEAMGCSCPPAPPGETPAMGSGTNGGAGGGPGASRRSSGCRRTMGCGRDLTAPTGFGGAAADAAPEGVLGGNDRRSDKRRAAAAPVAGGTGGTTRCGSAVVAFGASACVGGTPGGPAGAPMAAGSRSWSGSILGSAGSGDRGASIASSVLARGKAPGGGDGHMAAPPSAPAPAGAIRQASPICRRCARSGGSAGWSPPPPPAGGGESKWRRPPAAAAPTPSITWSPSPSESASPSSSAAGRTGR